MFEALLPLSDYLIAAQAVHPRALSPEDIAAVAQQQAYTGVIELIPDTGAALERATELVGPHGLICTAGSLFIVGEMRTLCGLPPGHVVPISNQLRTACDG